MHDQVRQLLTSSSTHEQFFSKSMVSSRFSLQLVESLESINMSVLKLLMDRWSSALFTIFGDYSLPQLAADRQTNEIGAS